MLTLEHDRKCTETGDAGWISNQNDVRDYPADLLDVDDTATNSEPSTDGSLFKMVYQSQGTLAERFPRLTVCAVALLILLTAVTAEIDCLRGSGYFWR